MHLITSGTSTPSRALKQMYTNTRAVLLSTSLLLTLLLELIEPAVAWMPDVRPDWQIKQDKINAVFIGNKTDYFKILDYDDASALIGARDVLYNISISNLRENSRLEWYSSDADRELCALKGKPESDCHNYIRVFARLDHDQMMLCGTNSYKPRCRNYAPTIDELNPKLHYEIVRDVEAQGLCPYSPAHNSTYAFADGQLYSGTVADFSGSDPLIYRENVRTEQYDLKQLNQPDFVGSIERNGFVMFFFRELAMEYMNFGKAVYSRVARICKNDRGGPHSMVKSWTSFMKARLNCSVPGDFPFYFDEIQAITPVVESGLNSLVYAVFTTSTNAIPGSAVCAFNIDDIMDVFEGRFKSQKDSQSHWLPVPDDQVPEPRPGKCVEDSRMLKTLAVNFIKNHPLMEKSVPALFGRPLMTKVNLNHRLTAIAIDSQIMSLNGEYYDVIYTGTDDGKVTKFFNIPSPSHIPGQANKIKTVVISEMQVLPVGVPVRELVVSAKTNTLLVASDGRIVTVALHHCTLIRDCLGCLSLQDPNCAWDQQNHECKSLTASNNKFGTKSYLQSLNTTKKAAAALCPKTVPGTTQTAESTVPLPATGSVPVVNIDMHALKDAPQNNNDELLLSKKLHYAKVGLDGSGSSGDLDMLPTAAGEDYLSNTFGDDKITLHSVDPDDIMNSINVPMQHAAVAVDEKNVHVAGKSLYWGSGIAFILLVFCLGFVVGGVCVTRRNCKTTGLHPAHRKQCNTNGQHGLTKDINLLMKQNHYINHKKPNIDLEKDRSHECKNSTENLEKELPCKTSTLTKVKRTYL